MIFYPAIDLKDGNCVRLLHGLMDKETIFNDSPANQAKEFAEQGAEWLHIVDLNGAFAGKPVNGDSVEAILAAVDIPIQLGGGIRDEETVKFWLDAGVSRVILGTIAQKDPELVKSLCKKYPNKIAVGIDAKNGDVAIEGWAEGSGINAIELAKEYAGCGVAAIIYTDIMRDGAMQGVNLQATKDMVDAVDIPIIASGGVASIDDVAACKEIGCGGVISGRAVYEGEISIKDVA